MLQSQVVTSWVLYLVILNPVTSELLFPAPFAFGVATAAYQIEGAWNQSGRGLSIWDVFSHTPNKTANGDTGDVADDHYHKLETDIALLKNLGVDFYRFSISWSRILPNGNGTVNQPGIDHYINELNLLTRAGIKPFVTLYHWDLPNALQEAGGWLNPNIRDYFKNYADICFENFGKYVSHWITFNEPYVFTWLGYGVGVHAPGYCSDRTKCPTGDSDTDPYIAAYNVLLAHADAYRLYEKKYKPKQGGSVGISLNCDWAEPYDNSSNNASHRYLEFMLGWFADPIFGTDGNYPPSMIQRVGSNLPNFTPEQIKHIMGTSDFFGLNHYTSLYVMDGTDPFAFGWNRDCGVLTTRERGGQLIGPVADSDWLYIVPWGIEKLLLWIYHRYGITKNLEIWITENGVDVMNESLMPIPEALNDTVRVNYYKDYLLYVLSAMDNDVNVVGYFAWSLMDNFEWADGYSKRFGLHYVDYTSPNLTRTPKASAIWYKHLIHYNYSQNRLWVVISIAVGLFVICLILLLSIVLYLRRRSTYQSVQ